MPKFKPPVASNIHKWPYSILMEILLTIYNHTMMDSLEYHYVYTYIALVYLIVIGVISSQSYLFRWAIPLPFQTQGLSLRVLGVHPLRWAMRPSHHCAAEDRLHGGGAAPRGQRRLPDVLRTETSAEGGVRVQLVGGEMVVVLSHLTTGEKYVDLWWVYSYADDHAWWWWWWWCWWWWWWWWWW